VDNVNLVEGHGCSYEKPPTMEVIIVGGSDYRMRGV
jgi:hypothetical protein